MKKSELRKLIRGVIKEQDRKGKGIKTFKVTNSNVSSVAQELSRINGTSPQTLEAEFKSMLSDPDHEVYDPRLTELDFGSCKCTHPPSMGFCKWGACVWGNWNFSKMEGGLTITINF